MTWIALNTLFLLASALNVFSQPPAKKPGAKQSLAVIAF
jgi:hypothetical protein